MRSKAEITEVWHMLAWLYCDSPNSGLWMACAAIAWVLGLDNFHVGQQFCELLVGWKEKAQIGGFTPPVIPIVEAPDGTK